MSEFKGDYIGTYSGKQVHLPHPDPESIDINDIARALSHAARFAGHTSEHWSVAQHSMACAILVPARHKLQALMHDATEAYLCDMPTPFKQMMPQYQELEHNLWLAIAQKFNLDPVLHSTVKEADRIMLMTERDVLRSNGEDWGENYENTIRVPQVMDEVRAAHPKWTMDRFLSDFYQYGGVA
jgi:5'-deoxynucleotidase YfbR-like HD superfamily hydrolase